MILKQETINAYNLSRNCLNNRILCHAPYTNLNFEQTGKVRACCYNYTNVLGTWPQQTIKQIWQGAQLQQLKGYIAKGNFGGGCIECGRMITAGNHQGVRARHYDEYADTWLNTKLANVANVLKGTITYPRVMEFELSNTCNLECVMCNGNFSSSIRKNREKRPPVVSPYNDRFVDELDEFIPHLTDAKFLGGEPFMIDIYLQIWERILKLNPGVRIHITTNGTFLNNRIKDLLEGLNAGIILSIDSINKETYDKIRINGNFDKVMENLAYFSDYAIRKKSFISIAACPIVYNWHEMPQMLDFCIEKKIALYFNAVFTPTELSLRSQSAEYLSKVIQYLQQHSLPDVTAMHHLDERRLSVNAYADFIKQLQGWLNEKQTWGGVGQLEFNQFKAVAGNEDNTVWSVNGQQLAMKALHTMQGEGQHQGLLKLQHDSGNMLAACPSAQLTEALLLYISFANGVADTKTEITDQLSNNLATIAAIINQHPRRADILRQIGQMPPLMFAQLVQVKTVDELKKDLFAHFSA